MICWDCEFHYQFEVQIKYLKRNAHKPNAERIQLDSGYDGDVLIPYALFF